MRNIDETIKELDLLEKEWTSGGGDYMYSCVISRIWSKTKVHSQMSLFHSEPAHKDSVAAYLQEEEMGDGSRVAVRNWLFYGTRQIGTMMSGEPLKTMENFDDIALEKCKEFSRRVLGVGINCILSETGKEISKKKKEMEILREEMLAIDSVVCSASVSDKKHSHSERRI